MSDSAAYEAHRDRLQREATLTHSRWVAGLSEQQREKLRKLGVLEPAQDRSDVGGHSPHQPGDLADTPLARVDVDVAAELDSEVDQLAEAFDLPLPLARKLHAWMATRIEQAVLSREGELVAIVIGGLLGSKNIRLAAGGLAFAFELDAVNNLGCQADFARDLGVSRQAVCKVVKAWARDLKLHPGAFQKSREASETYSRIGRERHWRSTKAQAAAVLARFRPAPDSDPSLS